MKDQCQSCGMPMKGQAEKHGTKADNSKSELYCVYCYQQGKFTQPNFSVQEMQKFCDEKMKEKGIFRPIRWLFKRSIPKLKRWSSDR